MAENQLKDPEVYEFLLTEKPTSYRATKWQKKKASVLTHLCGHIQLGHLAFLHSSTAESLRVNIYPQWHSTGNLLFPLHFENPLFLPILPALLYLVDPAFPLSWSFLLPPVSFQECTPWIRAIRFNHPWWTLTIFLFFVPKNLSKVSYKLW